MVACNCIALVCNVCKGFLSAPGSAAFIALVAAAFAWTVASAACLSACCACFCVSCAASSCSAFNAFCNASSAKLYASCAASCTAISASCFSFVDLSIAFNNLLSADGLRLLLSCALWPWPLPPKPYKVFPLRLDDMVTSSMVTVLRLACSQKSTASSIITSR